MVPATLLALRTVETVEREDTVALSAKFFAWEMSCPVPETAPEKAAETNPFFPSFLPLSLTGSDPPVPVPVPVLVPVPVPLAEDAFAACVLSFLSFFLLFVPIGSLPLPLGEEEGEGPGPSSGLHSDA